MSFPDEATTCPECVYTLIVEVKQLVRNDVETVWATSKLQTEPHGAQQHPLGIYPKGRGSSRTFADPRCLQQDPQRPQAEATAVSTGPYREYYSP